MIISSIIYGLILSSFLFPSLLEGYTYFGIIQNRIQIGSFIFVIDEIIILVGLLGIVSIFLISGNLSSTITKNLFGLILPVYILISFIVSYYLYNNNSTEIVLRNRWIFLNLLFIYAPFILKPKKKSIVLAIRFLIKSLILLSIVKISLLFIVGFVQSPFFQISPDFSFFLSLALLIVLINSNQNFLKLFLFLIALITVLATTQMSSIIFFIVCTYLGFTSNRVNEKKIVQHVIPLFMIAFVSLAIFSNVNSIIVIGENLGFNMLNFSDAFIKLSHYNKLWSSAIETVYDNGILFGVGIGRKIEFAAPASVGINDAVFSQSLAHNMIITFLFSFGTIGLIFLVFTLKEPILINKKIIQSNQLLLTLKLMIMALSINFLTTPGIWKIRKGVIFWLAIGLFYYFKNTKNNVNYQFSK